MIVDSRMCCISREGNALALRYSIRNVESIMKLILPKFVFTLTECLQGSDEQHLQDYAYLCS